MNVQTQILFHVFILHLIPIFCEFLPGYVPTYNITRQIAGLADKFAPRSSTQCGQNITSFCAQVRNSSVKLNNDDEKLCNCECNDDTPIFNQYLKTCTDVFGR